MRAHSSRHTISDTCHLSSYRPVPPCGVAQPPVEFSQRVPIWAEEGDGGGGGGGGIEGGCGGSGEGGGRWGDGEVGGGSDGAGEYIFS